MRVLVLGAGKMVEAILTGLKSSENLSEWMIYSPSGTSAQNLAAKMGARAVTELKMVKDPDWVIVGCKPQQLKDLKITIGDQFKDSLMVSLLAAVSEEDQRKILGARELIRVMPNLPVEYNVGVVLMSSSSSQHRLSSFQKLFSKLGEAYIVKEEELEELTLLTGSGPAFFYEFTENLASCFTSLHQEEREKLARLVLLGAGKAASLSQRPLGEMINAVTSKGGVTIAVLEKLRSLKLMDLISEGILSGKKKTEEIKSHLRS